MQGWAIFLQLIGWDICHGWCELTSYSKEMLGSMEQDH